MIRRAPLPEPGMTLSVDGNGAERSESGEQCAHDLATCIRK